MHHNPVKAFYGAKKIPPERDKKALLLFKALLPFVYTWVSAG
jgi:hypothetical protein